MLADTESVRRSMSLASYATVAITAVRMAQGRDDLHGITHVQWEGASGQSEESSVEDLIRWLDRSGGRAYIQGPDGVRGSRLHVASHGPHRYICGDSDVEATAPLLSLPRLRQVTTVHRTPVHRRRGRQTESRR